MLGSYGVMTAGCNTLIPQQKFTSNLIPKEIRNVCFTTRHRLE